MFCRDDIPGVERGLAEKGVPLAELYRECEIASTTWLRWRDENFFPSHRSAQRVTGAINRLLPDYYAEQQKGAASQ